MVKCIHSKSIVGIALLRDDLDFLLNLTVFYSVALAPKYCPDFEPKLFEQCSYP